MAAGKTDEATADSTANTSDDLNDSDLAPLQVNEEGVFGLFDAVLIIISLTTYLVDSLTDVLVSVEYFQAGHYTWGGLTMGLVVFPSFIIQVFSLRWYHADGRLTGCRPWLVHIFNLQPLERYLQALVAGVEARKSSDPEKAKLYYYQQNDVCMLRLFEAFLESAPQLTLQVYIMVATDEAGWLTKVSAGVSLVAIGWGVAAYNHALRRAHKDNYRLKLPGLILQTLWHFGIVAARVCALVAFASLYKAWVFLVLGLHWALMTVWVVLQNTDFCPTSLEEKLFDGIVGIIYIYCFFSLKEGQTRWRMTVFYTIMFVENLVLVSVWYPFKEEDGWTTDAIIAIAFGAFFLGLACMLVYYRFCHPTGPIYCCPPSQDYSPEEAQGDQLPRKNSGLYKLQVDLVPRTSTALLPRKAQLKPQTSLARAAPPVIYKEVYTPSQLTPIKNQPGDHRVIDYDKTFELDSTSMFQHYSIEASQAIANSQCASLRFEGIDLTNMTFGDPSRVIKASLIEDIENPRRAITEGAQDGELSPANMFENNFDPCGFDHPSFSFIDDNAPSVHSSTESVTTSDINHSPGEKALSLAEEPAMPSLGSLQFTGSLTGQKSEDEINKVTTPKTQPRNQHSCDTPAILANFSPIHQGKFLNSNAGCFKFPLPSEDESPKLGRLSNGGNFSAFASTPYPRQRPLSFAASDSGSNDSVFCDVGNALAVRAPLASPEASLGGSSCSELEDTIDDSINISSYDNVPASDSADESLGAYLDNVSGLTYTSPTKRVVTATDDSDVNSSGTVLQKLTTV